MTEHKFDKYLRKNYSSPSSWLKNTDAGDFQIAKQNICVMQALYHSKSGRFGALKSDSTHHFFRNACTKSGSLRFFTVFRLLTDFVCLYNYEFLLSLCKIAREFGNFVITLIKWWFKSGETSDLGLNWLRSNLDNKIGQLDNISLYVWLGTCDLTFKANDTVDIRENRNEAIDNLIRNCEDIVTLIQGYPVCSYINTRLPCM